MKEIIVRNQEEYDCLSDFSEIICIKIYGDVCVCKNLENSHVVARENSHVEALDLK